MLTHAEATAKRQHKNVMLVFTASWCGPCHLLQNFLADPAIRPIFDRHFVKVTVFHAEHVRRRDTPGADQMLDSLQDTDTSIPFIAMLGGNGKLIVDSVRPVYGRGRDIEYNIGFPYDPNSQVWFLEMLRRGAPSLTSSETQTIRKWLFQHKGN
ncbi:thioredoxin family protein [Granulicella aggregans]|nr:thioredoxin family protein [Granulicella aggregans]